MVVRHAVLGLAVLHSAAAWAQVPAGGEFRVNTYTPGQQTTALVAQTAAARPDGGFVLAWAGPGAIGPGIFVQRFDAAGARVGPEQLASALSASADPSVAADGRGAFIVGWTTDSFPGDIGLRRFDAGGTPLGAPFVANSFTPGFQYGPSVVFPQGGGFVVAWTSEGQDGDYRGVFARLFDGSGMPRGPEFQVNQFTPGAQAGARAAALRGTGDFVVVWRSEGQDGSSDGAFARRYRSDGAPLGGEFRVNSYTTGRQCCARVAALDGGRFVVAWASAGQDGGFDGIYAQRYDAAGAPLGGEFRVNTYTTSSKLANSVDADEAGNFVITWSSAYQDGDRDGVFARRFAADGTPRGGEFQVNSSTPGVQLWSSVASDPSGNLLVGWSDWQQLPANDIDVRAQRYGGLVPAALAVDAAPGPASDGNGVLEAAETVDVSPAWRNVNGAAQTFTGAAASFTGPGTPGNPTYTIADGSADYGTVPDGATRSCTAGGNCYAVALSVPAPRPATHWDASLREDLAPAALGQVKLWRLHVGGSFLDVPRASPYYRFVEALLHRDVTAGCGPSLYCPVASTSREQMAVFVLVAKEGSGYAPPACGPAPLYADVPATSPFCPWIEELARRGVVGGCGGGNYCPTAPVSREQMAVFVLLTLDPALNPPPCAPPNLYADVPETSPFCRWIEELTARGVVTGCGGGNYCPADAVNRGQMGVFLGVTFALALYGV